MANNLVVTQHLQAGLLAAKATANSASSTFDALGKTAGGLVGQVDTAAGKLVSYGEGAMSQLDGASKSLTSNVRSVLNSNTADLGSTLGNMGNKALSALGLGGAASKLSGALGGAIGKGVGGALDSVQNGVRDKLNGSLGGLIGSSLTSDVAKGNDYGITREAWELSTGAGLSIQFNINPSSVDFQFQGRAGIASVSTGRIIDQYRANENTGALDFDLAFNMQTGSLLSENMEATAGHETLMKIFQAANEDMYLADGVVNIHTLRINSVLFGYMELQGRLSPNLAFNENASEPWKNEYTLNFWVLKSTPALTNADALLKSVSSNG